jgi:hypothetical protein
VLLREGPREPARAPPPGRARPGGGAPREYHRADERPGEAPSARLRWLFATLSLSQSTIRGVTGEAGADAARSARRIQPRVIPWNRKACANLALSARCIQPQGIRDTLKTGSAPAEALAAHDHRAFETPSKPALIRQRSMRLAAGHFKVPGRPLGERCGALPASSEKSSGASQGPCGLPAHASRFLRAFAPCSIPHSSRTRTPAPVFLSTRTTPAPITRARRTVRATGKRTGTGETRMLPTV